MSPAEPFVDIHCHILPGIDDGADDWRVTLAMARMAAAEGIETIVATPHQLGAFAENRGEAIRALVAEAQRRIDEERIQLRVLPGADVRIEDDMLSRLAEGDVLSLADRRRHVLLELPHELYFPIENLLEQLKRAGLVGILSHPERNQGILRRPEIVSEVVQAGGLTQVTAGSITGGFGGEIQKLSDRLLTRGLVHFVSTDAHGVSGRRPTMRRAFERTRQVTDEQTAIDLFCRNPAAVVEGREVSGGRRVAKRRSLKSWFGMR